MLIANAPATSCGNFPAPLKSDYDDRRGLSILRSLPMNIVNITPDAAQRINELMAAAPGKQVRLSVVKSGCSGNKYDLAFVDEAGPDDEKVTDNGATILVEPRSLFVVLGMTIGWKEDRFGRLFTFDNNNEAGRCGCGESFHT
jgi:iron-sulfur cluster assembly protein